FGHGFTIDFRDAAARDAYLAHEAHQRAGARLVAALEGGTDGLMVLDLEFTEM
ncbi:MAG: Dabb family protein, partial [Mesorhizobium sp.]